MQWGSATWIKCHHHKIKLNFRSPNKMHAANVYEVPKIDSKLAKACKSRKGWIIHLLLRKVTEDPVVTHSVETVTSLFCLESNYDTETWSNSYLGPSLTNLAPVARFHVAHLVCIFINLLPYLFIFRLYMQLNSFVWYLSLETRLSNTFL